MAHGRAKVKSYPSDGPEPHNPIGEYQGDPYPFGDGFLPQTSIVTLGGHLLVTYFGF